MRQRIVLLCVYVLFVPMVAAQEVPGRSPTLIPSELSSATRSQSNRQSNAAAPTDPSIKVEQSFYVQFTQFRYKHSLDVHRTSSEIVQTFDQLLKDGKIELVQTVRLTVPEHHENMMQIGKTTSVIAGITRTPQGIQQQSRQSASLGTLVQVKVTPQESKVLLKVAYTVSRMDDNLSEEKQPDTVTVTFNSTLLLDIGKATLVGGMTSDTNDFLMVTISKSAAQ